MKTSIVVPTEIFNDIASGRLKKLKVAKSQEPELGLVRLTEFGDNYNHIDILVTSKRNRFNKIEFKFKVIAVYSLG